MFKEHTEGETWTLSDCPGVCGQRYSCNIREVWTVGAACDTWLGQRACDLERVCRLSLVLSCYHCVCPWSHRRLRDIFTGRTWTQVYRVPNTTPNFYGTFLLEFVCMTSCKGGFLSDRWVGEGKHLKARARPSRPPPGIFSMATGSPVSLCPVHTASCSHSSPQSVGTLPSAC